ncbi:hypothetical protein D3C71_1575350 [compost metagenome]
MIIPCSALSPPANSSTPAINAIATPHTIRRANGGSPASSVDIVASTSTAESAEVTKKIINNTSAITDSTVGIGRLSNIVNNTVS